jgi:hypothetical protein
MTTQAEWLEIHRKVETARAKGQKIPDALAPFKIDAKAYANAIYQLRRKGVIPSVRAFRIKKKKSKPRATKPFVEFAPVNEGRIEVRVGEVTLSVMRGDKEALRTIIQIAKELA